MSMMMIKTMRKLKNLYSCMIRTSTVNASSSGICSSISSSACSLVRDQDYYQDQVAQNQAQDRIQDPIFREQHSHLHLHEQKPHYEGRSLAVSHLPYQHCQQKYQYVFSQCEKLSAKIPIKRSYLFLCLWHQLFKISHNQVTSLSWTL